MARRSDRGGKIVAAVAAAAAAADANYAVGTSAAGSAAATDGGCKLLPPLRCSCVVSRQPLVMRDVCGDQRGNIEAGSNGVFGGESRQKGEWIDGGRCWGCRKY